MRHNAPVTSPTPPAAPHAAIGLEPFLLGRDDPPPDLGRLAGSPLAAYAATRLGDRPGAEALRRALLLASARHLAVRAEVAALLRAWREAGLEALLFKGFALAEWTYPAPGGRHYSDVDLLLPSGRASAAAEAAERLGWTVAWRADGPATAHSLRSDAYRGHELLQLVHGRLGVQLDVHRRLVHNNHNRLPFASRQARITRLAWAASREVAWEGTRVRLLAGADAVLVGLVLNRAWSGEDWELRPHDYLDFALLVERHGLTERALRERARALGCGRTLELFLERCDPFRRHLDLRPPGAAQRHLWNLRVASERGNRYLERAMLGALDALAAPAEVLRELPGTARALRLARAAGGPAAAAARLEPLPAPRRPLRPRAWEAIKRGVHRSLRLLGADPAAHPELEALALLAALRRRSVPATLRLPEGEPPRLELDGAPLRLSGTVLRRRPG